MNSITRTATSLFFALFTTVAGANEFASLCNEDGTNAGLTGSELNDYVASCLSQYGADESAHSEYEQPYDDYSNEYAEDDSSEYSNDDQY